MDECPNSIASWSQCDGVNEATCSGGSSIGRPASPQPGDESLTLAQILDGTRRSLDITLLSLAVVWALVVVELSTTGWPKWLSFGGACLVVGIVMREIFLWARLRQVGPAKLSFETQEVHVRGPDGHSHLAIAYDRILSLERVTWPWKASALYVAGRPPLDLPDTLFTSASDVAKLATELHERIGSLPDGADRLRAMARRTQAGAELYRRPPWCSLGLVAGLTLVFVLQVSLGATGGEQVVLLGASSGELLLNGEVLRLLSPALLHGSVPHLATNALMSLVGGGVLEGFLGRARAVLLFGLPTVVGFLASSLSDPTATSPGASAGAMGLVGALLAMNAYHREELPGRLRFPAAVVTSILAYMLIGEFWWWSAIDHAAHLGGLLSGGALYWLMVRKRRLSELLPTPSNVTRLGWAVGIAYALAFGHVLLAAWQAAADL